MGRKRKNKIYSYFDYDKEINKSKCLIEGCGLTMKGNHGSNLLRHFYTQHRTKYDELKKRVELEKQNDLTTKTESSTTLTVIDNCVNLVAVHGRPFTLLQDEAFQNLIQLIPNMNKSYISPTNIKTKIEEKAYEIRRQIYKETENKLLCLKVDVASVKSRRFLGINLQYIKDATLVLRNLSVLELHERNTATFLKDTIITVLSRYGITINQIYSLTSDNGANMLAMSRQIADLQAILDETAEDKDSSSEDNIDWDYWESDNLHGHQQLVDNLNNIEFEDIVEHETLSRMTAVRCAAHTLQLAVKDACLELQPFLEECRQAVRVLRTPNVALVLRQNNLPQAILDCPTRWDSIVNMLERLMRLKQFCSTHTLSLQIEENSWTKIEQNLQALKPCRELSKTLQKEQIIMGDFYIAWLKCKLEVENMNTPLAILLGICMTEREYLLLTNDVFLSALYLDPRVNSTLSDEHCEKARNHLIATYQRYLTLSTMESTPRQNKDYGLEAHDLPNSTSTSDQCLESASNNIESQPSRSVEEGNQPSTSSAIISPNVSIDIFLQRQHRERRYPTVNNTVRAERVLLNNSLKNFLDEPLLPSNANILEFWKNRKITNHQLYLLSQITLATPPTQVSVERLFSSLKFVLNNLRMSLKDSSVEDILVVRNNTFYNK
ncbi:unnamed protein product [Chilo suppressalis]|uniref:HAT C-terminal dimerisation domain-containing protein n=1 Tax=Chilo suppressalis TaxID=168631 RepID=A0ABN8L9M9_CHISP|nr:unnamed protein product [Chilo suppressalis]